MAENSGFSADSSISIWKLPYKFYISEPKWAKVFSFLQAQQ